MTEDILLDSYLKQLKLPTFLSNWRGFSEDAAQANLSYGRFLLALAEQEVIHREKNRLKRRIKGARFPVLKELADFDFSVIPSLNVVPAYAGIRLRFSSWHREDTSRRSSQLSW